MGYNTSFDAPFKLSKEPSAEAIAALERLYREPPNGHDGKPHSRCQWLLTPDHRQIAWDSNEKFYFWQEWLQWIIDRVLKPEGLELSGDVAYHGEEDGDSGTIEIVNGRVWTFPD